MANFDGLTLTRNGRRVLAQAQIGLPLHFTRVAAGDGELPPDADIYEMNDLINYVRDMPVNSNTIIGDGTTKIDAVLTNKDLTVPYEFRELGIFATDNETGDEIMYSYTCAERPDLIPAGGGPHAVNILYSIYTAILQATNVTIKVTEGYGFVTPEQMEHRIIGLFGEYVTPTKFWMADDSDPYILRPATIKQVYEVLFGRTATTDESVILGFRPLDGEPFGIPLSRMMIKAERLSGGSLTRALADYSGNISGGSLTKSISEYEGELQGGDLQTL